jgi:hypothetical protein
MQDPRKEEQSINQSINRPINQQSINQSQSLFHPSIGDLGDAIFTGIGVRTCKFEDQVTQCDTVIYLLASTNYYYDEGEYRGVHQLRGSAGTRTTRLLLTIGAISVENSWVIKD